MRLGEQWTPGSLSRKNVDKYVIGSTTVDGKVCETLYWYAVLWLMCAVVEIRIVIRIHFVNKMLIVYITPPILLLTSTRSTSLHVECNIVLYKITVAQASHGFVPFACATLTWCDTHTHKHTLP